MPVTGSQETIAVGQIEIRFRLTADQTGGSFTMFEFSVPANARVPIPHYHEGFDETVYGLKGTLTWTVGGEQASVGPGEVLFIPRGTVHQFHNESADVAEALSVIVPGILGPDFFREAGEVLSVPGPPDPKRLVAVMERHGLKPVIPS